MPRYAPFDVDLSRNKGASKMNFWCHFYNFILLIYFRDFWHFLEVRQKTSKHGVVYKLCHIFLVNYIYYIFV